MPEPVGRPDLILVMTDQQRHDQMGCTSGGRFDTPTMDRLARAGVLFDHAYSASTTCVPARNSLLTGLLAHRLPTQENGAALREGLWTIARGLRQAGYETALIGKMHFTPVHADHGFETMRLCEHLNAQGFGPLSRERDDLVDDFHLWLQSRGLTDPRGDGYRGGTWTLGEGTHPTDWVEQEASALLARRDRSRPLFLVVSFPHPHAPYDPPEPYASMFDPADSILPPYGYELNEGLPLAVQLATSSSSTREQAADPQRLRRFLATVRGLVRHIDDAIGRLVDQLDLTSALLMFTSDHGDYAGHRGLLRKTPWIPFDDLARVPLLAIGAGVSGGRTVSALVQSSDLPLTFLEVAGAPPPPRLDFDSQSLVPLLRDRGARRDLERTIVCGTTVSWPMIRQGRHKYLEHRDRGDAMLFDLATDPHERTNLAGDPALAATEGQLAAGLAEARRRPPVDVIA